MSYVITCGDEGVQINEGTRLGVLGAGVELTGLGKVIPLLKKTFGDDLRIASSDENAWVKQKLDLSTWEQTSASMQQYVQALADTYKLLYAGSLPFADPQELEHDIRGHMVRPKGVHIANGISFTLGGGEQKFHLGHFVISADWVADADEALVKEFLGQQIEFYNQLVKMELPISLEMNGGLGEEKAEANKKMLESIGIKATE